MTTLYLNGKRAVVDEGQALKLVRENTYFTKSGTYTYNISLPICPENIAIFGMLSRKDINKSEVAYNARLVVKNRDVVNGTATVTNISEDEIKVQLLGGNSELNFYNKNENRYIDELPLGTWYDVAGVTSSDLTMRSMAERIRSQFNSDVSSVGIEAAYKNLCNKIWNENTKEAPVDWVALPCVNENFDVTCNNFGIKTYTDNNGNSKRCPAINNLDKVYLSAQPYLVQMIERVFNNLGYPVQENCLRNNEFFMHLVIVTANNRSAIARALPHWTVAQFIEEIENLFGVVFLINESTKKTLIKSRGDYFKDNIEYIDNILDEYSVSMETDETTDIANANVGYAEVTDVYDRIDDDIREAAKVDTTYDNEADLAYGLQNLVTKLSQDRGNGQTSTGLLKHKGTIFKVCGHSYIIELYDHVDGQGRTYTNHARTIAIDEFANLINVKGKKDVDIELKICPAKSINDGTVDFYNADGSLSYTKSCFHLVKADNTDPAGIENETNIYIAGLISGETEKVDTKEDIMSICLYDGGMAKRAETDYNDGYPSSLLTQVENFLFYPAGYIKDQWQANTYTGGGTIQKFAYESLALNIDSTYRTVIGHKYTFRTFYSEVFKRLKKIDTQVKYCFKFITDRMDLPVNSTFIIRNKKFVCEKLEYNIKADGVSELVTGYFYELEE
ncbi:MAG: hypothetical protein IJ436_08465 [Bacteroidaceae bacterium]|nr:hypothetical protein [Bacteroidaceae bacterium]MBQ8543491.1 hypothetical protein [Bacteroidaceae bacterium]